MNKGITAEQVAKAMDVHEDHITVTEWCCPRVGYRYQLRFSTEDIDFSMHEIMALAALFGATGVSASLGAGFGCIGVTET